MSEQDRERDRRIGELQAQLQTARRRISALEFRLAGLIDPGAGRQMHAGFEMPSPAEVAALMRIVQGEFPMLRASEESFASAFAFLATVSRSDKMSNISNPSWLDAANEWLRVRERPEVNLPAFVLALLAHGDIVHTAVAARLPHDFSFALVTGGNKLPDGSGWRALLETGTVRPPSKLPLPAGRSIMQLDMTTAQNG